MRPFDLTGLRTYDLASRPSKVHAADLGRPVDPSTPIGDWLESLPKQLAANELRRLRDFVVQARRAGKPFAIALGGHVIKTGCAPYLIDLIRRGVITSVSMNGSAAIHDFELALAGKTSEDVAAQLGDGRFGMARETADAFAAAAVAGAGGIGLGSAMGQYIADLNCPYAADSLVHACHAAGIPCTVHVALGTDIVHMHPQVSGAALGESSMIDFRLLCGVVAGLGGGVWLNLGSAVVMPEVFLKAVSVARNFGHDLDGLVTANFDKESKYRTGMNVLRRPGSVGIEVIGHHEILIPLFHVAVSCQVSGVRCQPEGRAA
ncbi:MAG TPA: hypothetical protein VH092_26385 [Urbifossiella sp.]|jgi:hypothetical protein|nr:hypothetical protein [Urbifossiella sp.]